MALRIFTFFPFLLFSPFSFKYLPLLPLTGVTACVTVGWVLQISSQNCRLIAAWWIGRHRQHTLFHAPQGHGA